MDQKVGKCTDKMFSKRLIWTASASALIALLFAEINPRLWEHEEMAVYSVNQTELFRYITKTSEVPEVSTVY